MLSTCSSRHWSDLESLRDGLFSVAATRLESTREYGGYPEAVNLYLQKLMEAQRHKLVKTLEGQITRLNQLCSEDSTPLEEDEDLDRIFLSIEKHLKEPRNRAPKHLRPAEGPSRLTLPSFQPDQTSKVSYATSWQHRK